MGAEGGATSLKEIMPGLPYFFSVLNFSDHNQMPVLADIFAEVGVKTAYIIYIADLHGIEYSGVAGIEFAKKGIDIVRVKSAPEGIKDLSPLLKEAKALEVDAFCSFQYPGENFLAIGQSMEIGFNPKAIILGPGGCFGLFKEMFGPVVEGVMGEGAWNCKSSPGAAEFCDKFIARYGEPAVDWWGHLVYWGGLQFWQQAVEKAGTLDQAVIRDIIATETFDTVLGPAWFEGGLLAVECYAGQIGQWQSGIFEVIDPGEQRTAEPIYPKPPWPPPPPG